MILFSFGTRPEWIKIKPLIQYLKGKVEYRLLFTGQHADLLSGIEDKNLIKLVIHDGPNRLDSIVQSTLNLEAIFENISLVVVQGDTTSAFSIALAAFHRKIKVAHLEAGLRTYDKNQPYPEEFNRQAISRIADIHLCPTRTSEQNLISEKVQGTKKVVGNTVLDNLKNIETEYSNKIIVTMHRRENHTNMKKWFESINNLAKKNKKFDFIIPIHPNPQVQKHKHILKNLKVVDPMEYKDFVVLLAKSRLVITDSGGLQEETSFFSKKCIVCREKTERVEGLDTFAFICKSPGELENTFNKLINDYIPTGPCPYGDGNSSERVYEVLKSEI